MKRFIFLVMALVFSSFLKAGDFEFKGVNELEVESSWTQLSDVATISLPSLNKQLEKSLNVGDPVELKLGYNDNLETEFTGYISEKSPTTPFSFKCEDEMYQLKRTPVNKSYKSITLKDLLAELIPNVKTNNIPDVTLSPLRLSHTNVAKVLEKIKGEYGIIFYFRGTTLNAGLPYFETFQNDVVYHLQKNTIERNSDLVFRVDTDRKIKIRAVSILPNNETITIEEGDPDGEVRTWHTYNINDVSQLKQLAQEQLKQLVFNGYEGELKAFGLPIVKHSQRVLLLDELYPSRAGLYFVDKVTSKVSKTTGFKRTVTLGRKAE